MVKIAEAHDEQVSALLNDAMQLTMSSDAAAQFSKIVHEREYSAAVFADALSRVWSGDRRFSASEVYRQVLTFHLQARLAREQIATQERLARAAHWLSWAAFALTVVSAVAAGIEIWKFVKR